MTRKHVPVHVWNFCPVCKVYAVSNCPDCIEVHNRLHHQKRRRRLRKAEVPA